MFGTFLLFILYVIASLGVLIGMGAAIFFLLKAKEELTQPKEFIELIRNPSLFLSAHSFSEEGNQCRLRFIQLLGISIGLLILILILKLILA